MPKLMFEKAIEAQAEDRFVFGAFDQDALIGICGYVPFTLEDVLGLENGGTIIQMYVRSSYSGRKIGLKLTQAVAAEAFENPNIDRIVLGVREGNMPAIRVYEQAGFERFPAEGGREGASDKGFRVLVLQR